MFKRLLCTAVAVLVIRVVVAQGVGVPSKKAGLGFGNLPKFSGVRMNFKDKDVERINGINVTSWMVKDDERLTGRLNGIAIGVPLAIGTEDIHGIGIGIVGVGARRNLYGINMGGLGVGAGGNVKGINMGGLGVGSGGNLWGINAGGLGVGSGGNVTGINAGGLGVGAGGKLSGLNIGGLGVGSGGSVSGISIGGLGVGSGDDLSGISIGGLGVGSGGKVTGIGIAGLGLGSGESVNGLMVAGLGVGAPTVRGVVVAAAAGGIRVNGLMIVPAYFKVGDKHQSEDSHPAVMRGASISAFNHILGSHNGISIGVFNYAYSQHGLQLGVLNYVKSNPKGLRLLPIFNTSF